MEKYYDIRIPDTGHEFELLTQNVCRVLFNTSFELYGRKGQAQNGIDLFSKDFEICVQCKNYQGHDAAKRLCAGMEQDFSAAFEKFGKSMRKYVLATTVLRDKNIQDCVGLLAQKYRFDISVIFWDDFQSVLKQHPEIILQYNQRITLPMFAEMNPRIGPFSNEKDHLFHVEKLFRDEWPEWIANRISKKPEPIQPLGRTVPSIRPFFTGRQADLRSIHQHLLDNRVTFLYGPRGIGKSALAAEYASTASNFRAKIWLTYDRSLKHTIESIVFPDTPPSATGQSPFERNFRWLQSLRKDVLIVLDNFDVLEEQEPLFYSFINCEFTLLVTSHVHHEGCCEMPIGEMQIEELRALFCHYYTKNKLSGQQVDDLICAAYSHTMVVEMTAKLMQNSSVAYEVIADELRKSVAGLELPVNVVLHKDGTAKNTMIRKHLEVLFDLASLQDEELRMLVFMAYMPLDGMSEALFMKWAEDTYGNSVTQLYRLGWLARHPESDMIRTHPIIYEMAHTRHREYENEIQHFVDQAVQYFQTEQSKDEDLSIRIASAIGYRLGDFESVSWIAAQLENASNLQNRGRKISALSLMEGIAGKAAQIEIPNYLQTLLHYRIGCLKLDMAEFDSALTAFEKALSFDAGDRIREVAYCALLTNCLLECSLAFAMKNKNIISQRFLTFAERLMNVLPADKKKAMQSRFYYKQGEILRLQGKHQTSAEAFRDAIAIRRELYGEQSLDVGLCYAQIGLAYRKLGDDNMAAKNLYKAYCIFDQLLPETHPNIVSVQLSLGITLENLTQEDLGVVQLLDYLAGVSTFDEMAEILPALREKVSALMTAKPSETAATRHSTHSSDMIAPVASAFGKLFGKFTKAKAPVMRDESGWRSYVFRNYDQKLFHVSNTGAALDDAVRSNPPRPFMSNPGDYHKMQRDHILFHGAVPNRPLGTSDTITQALDLIDELPPDFLKSNAAWFFMLTYDLRK